MRRILTYTLKFRLPLHNNKLFIDLIKCMILNSIILDRSKIKSFDFQLHSLFS